MILHNILGKGKMVNVCIVEDDKTSPIKIGSNLKHNTNLLGYVVVNIGNVLYPRHFTVKYNTQILVIVLCYIRVNYS